jgi:RHH-type proline utilization regulon transcriptional repressor/proline dehydrogenase/delta 1-pyrroline-5-carboxylate dehydrogenase
VLQLARWRQASPPAGVDEPLPEPVAARLERCLSSLTDDDARALVRASAASYVRAWRRHFGREHEPIAIPGERNAFRYRPCRRVIVRGSTARPEAAAALGQVVLAVCVVGASLTVSLSPDSPPWAWLAEEEEEDGGELVVETEAGFVERLAHPGDAERVRAWQPISAAARATAAGTGLTVIDAPVLANGRLELRWYVREQTVSRILHRYGSVAGAAAGE